MNTHKRQLDMIEMKRALKKIKTLLFSFIESN